MWKALTLMADSTRTIFNSNTFALYSLLFIVAFFTLRGCGYNYMIWFFLCFIGNSYNQVAILQHRPRPPVAIPTDSKVIRNSFAVLKDPLLA